MKSVTCFTNRVKLLKFKKYKNKLRFFQLIFVDYRDFWSSVKFTYYFCYCFYSLFSISKVDYKPHHHVYMCTGNTETNEVNATYNWVNHIMS